MTKDNFFGLENLLTGKVCTIYRPLKRHYVASTFLNLVLCFKNHNTFKNVMLSCVEHEESFLYNFKACTQTNNMKCQVLFYPI